MSSRNHQTKRKLCNFFSRPSGVPFLGILSSLKLLWDLGDHFQSWTCGSKHIFETSGHSDANMTKIRSFAIRTQCISSRMFQCSVPFMTRKEKKHQATQYFSSLPSSFHLVIAALRAQPLPFRALVHGLGGLGAAGLDLFVGPLVALLQDLRHQVLTRPGRGDGAGWWMSVEGV